MAPGLIVFGVVLLVGADAGGYFPTAWRLSALALLSFAAAALVERRGICVSRLEWTLLAAFALVVGWIVASSLWSDRPALSLLEGERALLYLAALMAVVFIAERSASRQMCCGIVAAVTLVAGYALVMHASNPDKLDPVEGHLLYQPIGYANALGILIVIALALALGLLGVSRTQPARALALGSLAILVSALYLTSSRGAWLVLAIGICFGIWCLFRTVRWTLLVPLLGAAIVVALFLGSSTGQGLSLGDENRPHYWQVALDDAADHPLLGSGAGTYADYWIHHEPIDRFARNAHSLYIESLAELGPIGLMLVALALAVPLFAVRRTSDAVLAAAAGAYVAFLVHAGIDWDWEIPAVTVSGLFSGAAIVVGHRNDDVPPLSERARWLLVASTLALIALVVVRLVTDGETAFP